MWRADRSWKVFLLLVIKSSPGNYERRQILRERSGCTWAPGSVFICGTTCAGLEERMNHLMEVAHRKHRDILQWDFQESFINLTLKQVLFLEWQEGRCPHVRFLLNGDDDVFAHTDNMVHYLQSPWKARRRQASLRGLLHGGNGAHSPTEQGRTQTQQPHWREIRIPSLKLDPYDPCYYKDILMVHCFLPHQLYLLWDQVHDPRLRCWPISTGS
ncbi:hypothetical protein NHX12_021121 [Muraenolepis orangiensis]|uniref:Hexosyltransferase n=1 Tax=Muraenolepis orangiensis TaxID=630683 RepID=A0A9Q0ET60_9TELE|nr:hypothetical protein NHX12_021121 [Muraenolepis orangiensis]